MIAPVPRPPGTQPTGPSTTVVVKVETYFGQAPFNARVDVRAANEDDALARFDLAVALARRQLLALADQPTIPGGTE